MKIKAFRLVALSLAFILIISGVLYIVLGNNTSSQLLAATPVPSTIPSRVPDATLVAGEPLINAADFLNPPIKNRPIRNVHTWKSNMDKQLAKTIDQKLDFLLDIGYGGISTNVEWNSKYMQDDKEFATINDVLSAAKSRNMQIWLFDENFYPSGPAGELTLQGHPEYEAIGVGEVIAKGSGIKTITISIPTDMKTVLSATVYPVDSLGVLDILKGQPLPTIVQNGKLTAQGIDGNWQIRVYGIYPIFVEGVYLNAHNPLRKYPNLLNKAAVARYIEVQFQEYKNKIPDFDNMIEAFFTEEPGLQAVRIRDEVSRVLDYPIVSWEDTIPKRFEDKYGYDLLIYLPSLFGGTSAIDNQVRQNYYELVGDMLSENFVGQIQEWCSKNGCEFSGHLLWEEKISLNIPLYGDYFQALDHMGYPGIDDLRMFPETFIEEGLLFGTKMAQSAASNKGIDTVFCEICPVTDLTRFEANRDEFALGSMGQLYLSGANSIHHFYNPEATSKEVARTFNNYTARMDYMLDGAKMNSSIAIFYPTKTAQQFQLPSKSQNIYDPTKAVADFESAVKIISTQLTNAKLDYSFVLENHIDTAELKDGYMLVGKNKYSVIILPSVQVLPLKTMKKLDKFAQSGGEVIFVNSLPTKSNIISENEQVKALGEKYRGKLISNSPMGNATNLALGAKVTASNTDGTVNYSPDYVTDGTNDTSNWTSWAGKAPGWVEIDLGKPTTFNTIGIYTQKNYEMSSYNIEYLEGTEWKNIVTMPINKKDINIHPFAAITAQRIRVNALKGSTNQLSTGRINEIEVFNADNNSKSKTIIEIVREASNMKLQLNVTNIEDVNKVILGQFLKNNRELYMVANGVSTPVQFTLEQLGAKSFTIYNPYDGSISKTDKNVTIPGYRALFFEPNYS